MKKGWEIKKLGEIYDVKSSKRVHKKDWKQVGIPFYRAREVVKLSENGFVNNELFISPELYNEYTKDKGAPKTDDIIISAVGTLGKCYLVRMQDKFYIKDASVLWLKKNTDIYSPYIIYAFKSDLIMKQVMYKSMGATVGTLTITRAKNIQIPIPPLPEQKHIVSILDRAFKAIDQAKANAEQNLKNAKELFQSKLQAIFDNGKLKVENGEWEEKKLGDVCKKTETINPRLKPENEFVYIDVSSVNKETKEIEEVNIIFGKNAPSRARKLVKTNDVIFATVRPTHQRVAVIPKKYSEQICSTGYYVLRANSEIDNNIIFYYLLTYSFNEQMGKLQKGASYPAVTNKEVESQIILFPKSKSEQKQIVQKLDTLQAETKKLETIYQQKIDDLKELKKSVLQKAFNGEL